MSRWERLVAWGEKNRDLGLEVIRIYLGVGLFMKGVYFAGHTGAVVSMLDASQIDVAGVALAHLVAGVHLVCGALVAVGLLTRIAAWAQVPILLGAVLLVHLREGLFGSSQNLEFALLVLMLLVLFGVTGGGRWSADAAMERRARRLTFPPRPLSGTN